ncbi:protealysin inhibitor emfourin [Crenothrix sp.]|uniref:protealysin inhibitor emfourin n=1 Tax=Crenothrix sp. TaxID=3100433 RepID=UPI00374DD7AE
MRVEFMAEGGIAYFPNLSKPIVIDSRDLSQNDAIQLKEWVDETHFFTMSPQSGKFTPGAADFRSYTITIEDDKGKKHSVKLTDPVVDPNMQQFLHFLKELAKSRE